MTEHYQQLAPFSQGQLDRVGLSGDDVSDPDVFWPDLVGRFNKQTNMPFTLHFGVPTDFEKLVANRPNPSVITGERNPLFQGIYSTRIELKQRMRETERLLTTDEKFGALSAWLGTPPDNNMIWRAWEPALFNVTHDQASGVMTDHVYDDVNRGYDFAQRLGGEMFEQRVGSVLSRIDTSGEGVPIVVFNTLGWSRTDVARGDVGFAEGGIKDFEVLDPAGKSVPAQNTEVGFFADGGLRRVKFEFIARDVPACIM